MLRAGCVRDLPSGLRGVALLCVGLASLGALPGCPALAGGLLLGGGIAAGRLSMTTHLTQDKLAYGAGQVGLVVGIDALELSGPRPPLNAALVLDRSGSMSGEKILYAKAAAKTFVRAMRQGDRIAIVTYSNATELALPSVPIDEGSQQAALDAIDRIEVAGMTNLSGGLLMGRDQVLQAAGDGRVNRVVLISDGVANVGITDAHGLSRLAEDMRERGVTLSSMGVGLDFNEDVMMRLADRGGGNYYYVRDAHRLASVFRGELQSLSGIVAQRPELRVRLLPGVRVRNVPGYSFEQTGDVVRVRLSDISGGSKRKVVLGLDVDARDVGTRELAQVSLGFATSAGKRAQMDTRVAAEVTRDVAVARRSVNVAAYREATRAQAADTMKQAVELYEQGRAGEATRHIAAQQRQIQRAARAYNFDDTMVQGELGGAAARLRAAPAPAADSGNHLRKALKNQAMEMAR